MSIASDYPLNEIALKINNTLASKHYTKTKLLFLTAQSAAFISKKQYRLHTNTKSQNNSYAQVTSPAKVYEKNSETEHVIVQSTEFQKTSDLIKQMEDLIETYLAKISDESDIETLKKVLNGHNAAYFPA